MRTGTTTCAVVGGGPAGMVLGLLLARAGVDVTVFEKHRDFLRDFRGDTVHPATLTLLDDLGLYDRFMALPHSEIHRSQFTIGGRTVTVVDFGRLRVPHPMLALVPQWDLLDLLADAAKDEPSFTVKMQTEVTGLLGDGGTVTGVRFDGPHGPGEMRADLTVACDGRTSLVRRDAGMKLREFPVPFDVAWFRLDAIGDIRYQLTPRFADGMAMVLIPREGYFQAGAILPKGGAPQLRARGLDAFRAQVAELVPEGSVDTIDSWDDVKVLDVRLDRLDRWHRPGLLCIGDAAHAMSPIGGVGINLAVGDAVAAAAALAEPLSAGRVSEHDLAKVQRRRQPPAVITQSVQRIVHTALRRVLVSGTRPQPPELAERVVSALLSRVPALSVVPAYFIGVGVRPERAPAFARRNGE